MNIDKFASEVSPNIEASTIRAIAKVVARDILKRVRWYNIDLDDIDREDSINYIRHVIKSDYDL